jgi:hypothetical protein
MIRFMLHKGYYYCESKIRFLLRFFLPRIEADYKDIPILINNYNRLECLLKLIAYLRRNEYTNIIIIDNASTYPPLLEYYRNSDLQIYYLNRNYGHLALWKSGLFINFINNYYVYTDPDVLPIEQCPSDFLNYFKSILDKNRDVVKVGFSLKIDDIPDFYKYKNEVIEWEKKWWIDKVDDNFYVAHIDTTFALYAPWAFGGSNEYRLSYRSDYPYVARHLPWYADSSNLTDEDIYYMSLNLISSHWSRYDK